MRLACLLFLAACHAPCPAGEVPVNGACLRLCDGPCEGETPPGTAPLSAVNAGEAATLTLPEIDGDTVVDKINDAEGVIEGARLQLDPNGTIAAINAGTGTINSTRLSLDGPQVISAINGSSTGVIDAARLPATLGGLGCTDDQTAVRRAGDWACEAAGPRRVVFVAEQQDQAIVGNDANAIIDLTATSQVGGGFAGNTFTAPEPGSYRFEGHVTAANHATIINFKLWVNGANGGVVAAYPTGTSNEAMYFTTARVMAQGDTVQLSAESAGADASYSVCFGDGCLLIGELLAP